MEKLPTTRGLMSVVLSFAEYDVSMPSIGYSLRVCRGIFTGTLTPISCRADAARRLVSVCHSVWSDRSVLVSRVFDLVCSDGDTGFVAVPLQDLFFNRVPGNKATDRDEAYLADPVGPVFGLFFDGGIPPLIEMNHAVGPGQVEVRATGFGRDEKELNVTVAEGIDRHRPLCGCHLTIPVTVRELSLIECFEDAARASLPRHDESDSRPAGVTGTVVRDGD